LAYARKGDRDKAGWDLEEAIAINPRLVLAYIGRGDIRREKGDFDRAISDYTEAIRLNPRLAEAYNGRGRAYAMKGEKANAQADFATARLLGWPHGNGKR
jgi:tetratricopeptide (TPR) repeat protein